MPKLCYVQKNFQPASLAVVVQANRIIEEYEAQGYSLTLRQLFYQFVSRDLLPNTQKSYSRLGNIISDGRLAGLIDWDAIEDRTRNLVRNPHWGSPASIIDSAASSYAIDKWEGQEYRIEVWIEKEALSGVFDRICSQLDVPFFACRGYVSQSEMWRAAQRLLTWDEKGYKTVVLHFGDHDPSGIDMTRDIQDRLRLFETEAEVIRLALTEEQIGEYDPPPNPAKATDSRFEDYRCKYGDESWELDALEPAVLSQLVMDAVFERRDPDKWGAALRREAEGQAQLQAVSDGWEGIVSSLDYDVPDLDADSDD